MFPQVVLEIGQWALSMHASVLVGSGVLRRRRRRG